MRLLSCRCFGMMLVALCLVCAASCRTEEKEDQETQEQEAQELETQGEEQGEEAMALEDLPQAVRQAAQKETEGSTIVGVSKEDVDGKTVYEVETTVNGRTRDILIDSEGVVTEIEEEVILSSLPDPIQENIRQSIGTSKLVKLESVTKAGQMTGYSALVESDGKQSEVEMGLDGKTLAKGK